MICRKIEHTTVAPKNVSYSRTIGLLLWITIAIEMHYYGHSMSLQHLIGQLGISMAGTLLHLLKNEKRSANSVGMH
jgi:hypothetical protein